MDARLFQEAIRSVTVTYPIPFMSGIFLLFGLLCFAGCAIFNDWMRVLLAVSGALSLATAIGGYVFAVTRKPELLRSERHHELLRAVDFLGDPDLSATEKNQMLGILELTGRSPRLTGRRGANHE